MRQGGVNVLAARQALGAQSVGLSHPSTASPGHTITMNDSISGRLTMIPDHRSLYSLATVRGSSPPSSTTSLLHSMSDSESYGTARPTRPSSRRILFNATLKMAAIFTVSTVLLGGTLWLALPTLDESVSRSSSAVSALILHTERIGRHSRSRSLL